MHLLSIVAICIVSVSPMPVTDIQGSSFISPFEGQSVTNVTGILMSKACRSYIEHI